jgi:hypothetical protein
MDLLMNCPFSRLALRVNPRGRVSETEAKVSGFRSCLDHLN